MRTPKPKTEAKLKSPFREIVKEIKRCDQYVMNDCGDEFICRLNVIEIVTRHALSAKANAGKGKR